MWKPISISPILVESYFKYHIFRSKGRITPFKDDRILFNASKEPCGGLNLAIYQSP